jgi:glycosyltransferase involved in cell wall biosynthesis
MIPILQAMAGQEHGGAEAFFERLAIALHRAGLPQDILIRTDPARAARLRDAGLTVTELPFGGLFDRTTRRRFAAAIDRVRPRLVLTWMSRATRFCPPARGDDFIHAARLGGYYDLRRYRHCHHLIGNTRDLCDWMTGQGWPAERVHYLPNFAADDTAPPVDRAAFATPADAPLILALGRLHANKAFDVLIRALADLPGTYLWIAGTGPLGDDLARLAESVGVADRTRFLGWRSDTAALSAAADLFVCPSRHEPLGNVVIEAWARRLPVVAAASQGPRQLILDGVNGLLAPIDDPPALAAACRRALTDPDLAGRLAAAGRDAFDRDFTERAVVARYLDFFATVTA